MREFIFNRLNPNKIIFFLAWFLCFSIALPHTILPGKAGSISFLLFIFWLFEGNLKEKAYILFRSKLFLSLIGFIFLLSLSILWTRYQSIGLARLSIFKYFFVLMPVLITSISKENTLKLIQAFVFGNILHALLMFLSSHGFINLPNSLKLYDPYAVYAPFFVFSFFYCLYSIQHYLRNKDILRSLILLLCLVLLIYLIFTNKGRAAQLAFICSTIITLILLHKHWRKTAIYTAIFIAAISIISSSSKSTKHLYDTAFNNLIEIKKGNYRGSLGSRWGLIVTNTKIIKENIVLGVGIGDTQDSMQRFIDRNKNIESYSMVYFDHSHNHYISIFISAGIFAFFMYILTHVFLFQLPIIEVKEKNLSYIFLTILIVNGLTDNILFYKPYNIYFAIMISLFINLSLDRKSLTKA